ncbi:MAG: hypothetical protein WAW73_09430 [Rhodoferax sp.]
MNTNALHSDYAAMGLAHYQNGQNAFQSVPPKGKQVKPYNGPKKTGPKLTKVQQAAISLETPEERKARLDKAKMALDQKGRATVALTPRTTGAITIHNRADADKSARIRRGRAI